MTTRLFLCGDVMTGRGVDQALPRSCDPRLHETHVRDARRYVEFAEEAHGSIPAPLDRAHPWGMALDILSDRSPDVRIVNLETAVTTSDDPWRGKGIHYRMHPGNVGVLEAAGIDCCALANNHVLDWGYPGLRETLRTLREAGIRTVGAGRDRGEAFAPAVVPAPAGRVLVYSFGTRGAGVPADWAAREDRPGVCLLPDLSPATARELSGPIREPARPEDVIVASVHWGPNWGYRVPRRQRDFARVLVEEAGVDVVHGHSSHHPRGVELHGNRPVLYGCGDLLNDYEGIPGREEYRGDLTFLYFVDLASGNEGLRRLEMVPARIRRFRLENPPEADRSWLLERMAGECRKLGTAVEARPDGRLLVAPT